MRRRHLRLEPAELAPCGELGVQPHCWYRRYDPPRGRLLTNPRGWYSRPITPPDFSDVRAARIQPWLLVLWEPLTDRAPGPHLTLPWCCYGDTVIFYCRPFQLLPPRRYLSWVEFSEERDRNGNRKTVYLNRPVIRRDRTGSFAEHQRIEYRLRFDDHVLFDGVVWHVGGGSVVWHRPWWWMRRSARRAQGDARCGICVAAANESAMRQIEAATETHV